MEAVKLLFVPCRGGAIYLRAIGWQMSEKDKIDLDGPKLRDKQGLYTCPGLRSNQKPFHSCLEVQEEKIKVRLFMQLAALTTRRQPGMLSFTFVTRSSALLPGCFFHCPFLHLNGTCL